MSLLEEMYVVDDSPREYSSAAGSRDNTHGENSTTTNYTVGTLLSCPGAPHRHTVAASAAMAVAASAVAAAAIAA
jgi:hypothetical protein